MTVRALTLISALLIPLAASAAAAQQTPPSQPPRPPVRIVQPSAFQQQTALEGDIWRNSLSQQATVITSPARMSRAERLAALINDGKCAEAHAIALAENDRRLARRISGLCSLED